jgi:tyrosyl-tRNA synthetase
VVEPDRIVFIVKGQTVADALKAAGFVKSKGEARRLLANGGVRIDSIKVFDDQTSIFDNCTLQKGKRSAVRLVMT